MTMKFSKFNPQQLEQYLERINYAGHASGTGTGEPRLESLKTAVERDPLTALTELQRRHLGAIPWGNSALHYSTHHSISVHPTAVFEKLVLRAHDGYCMENTNLLYVVLRSLGYRVYPTGGRVSRAVGSGNQSDEGYISFNHMVLVVTIASHKYMVDVGFGRNSPTSPLPLQENILAPLLAPSEMSLIKTSLTEFVDETQKLWVYRTRSKPQKGWIPQYCFSEVEFLPEDFAMMNYFTSQSRTLWFTHQLACTRVLMDEDKGIKPVGIYILSGTEVKRVSGGETTVVATIAEETDRVEALARYFGMHFRPHEIEGIRGLPSQIRTS
ncbi:arylamine N-acetyltransferase family protein [Aspergillus aculeatinus CBS 121060]|uniref:Arylamine N-acetyltransferase 1 n=1 Tax=Aspergillus aculeatinus CBS 121060 TaxID=1448322 RepID=A0ACD1GUL2_9EURO|nr:arylamine N-acetyltransferase 1 [Aspergillus aculeatinus CBS 121060]RAH65000.1 arylamine N-acetyltransferase 1 [Aspergillus aculeatinus CBS 121060]